MRNAHSVRETDAYERNPLLVKLILWHRTKPVSLLSLRAQSIRIRIMEIRLHRLKTQEQYFGDWDR